MKRLLEVYNIGIMVPLKKYFCLVYIVMSFLHDLQRKWELRVLLSILKRLTVINFYA